MEVNISNLQSKCRTCLKTLHGTNYNIFQTLDLKRKLLACTSLTMDINDGYPSRICESCLKTINAFNEFQEMCINSMQICNELLVTVQKEVSIELDTEEVKTILDIVSLPEIKGTVKHEVDCSKDLDYLIIEPHEPEILQLLKQNASDAGSDLKWEESIQSEGIDETDENECDNEDANNIGKFIEYEIEENSSKKASVDVKKKLSCKLCNKTFKKETMVTAHMRMHEGLRPFACSQCDKSFIKLPRLRLHIRSVHECIIDERLVCPVEGCERSYALKQTLTKHIKDAHNDSGTKTQRQYICEFCGKVLTSLTTLTNHLFIHTGQQLPFECTQCHKRYITKHKLKEHMNRHAGIKNYSCPYCGAKKTTRTELNTHVNYHTQEKKYPCKCCQQVFNSVGNLGRHVRIVHIGIKDFPCKYCEKSFGKAETRKHHEMIHTGEKPHKCLVCSKRFIQLVSLQKHMQRHNKPVNKRPLPKGINQSVHTA